MGNNRKHSKSKNNVGGTVSGSVGIYEIEFEFSDDWAGFGKTAVFQSAYGESWEQVLVDDKCIIPHEVLIARNPKLHELLPIRIGVYGVSGGMVKPTAWTCPLQLHIGATEGTPHVDPTPTQWEQILARLGEIDADVIVLRERVDEYSIAIDIVGTKADLDAYDTSGLHLNDKVKVLADETHSDKVTYWKWTGTAWEYVGLIDTGYTKAEADAKFEKLANKTTSVNSSSTDTMFPTAKAVFTAITNGIVAVAKKLQKARSLMVNLSSTSAQSFDGSANATNIGVSGTLPIDNGGTGATTAANARKNMEIDKLLLERHFTDVTSTSYPKTAVSLCRIGNIVFGKFSTYDKLPAGSTEVLKIPNGFRPFMRATGSTRWGEPTGAFRLVTIVVNDFPNKASVSVDLSIDDTVGYTKGLTLVWFTTDEMPTDEYDNA